jgi:hypothetical protein
MEMKNKRKLISFLLLFVLVFVFAFAPIVKVKAGGTWGETFGANTMQTMMERIFKIIQDFIRGAMKQMAVQSIVSSVSGAVGGGGGSGAMFIVNYKDFLVTQPQEKTKLALNDFFSSTTRGKGSSLNYVSNSGGGSSGNYASQVQKAAKDANTFNAAPPVMDLQQYASGPSTVFDKNNWIGYTALISNPANNFGLHIMAKDVEVKTMEEEQKNAETEAAAGQGFLGKKSGDNVMTPGSLVGKMEAQAQDVGNKAMASATSLPEIITSLVSRMAMQALTQGIGNVSAQIKSSASTKSQNAKTSANKNSSGNPQARFNLKF